MSKKKYHRVSKDKEKKYRAKHHAKHPEVRIHTRIKRRAREQGLEFDLTHADVVELFSVKVCPVLHIPLFKGKTHSHNSPSIDRMDNSRGYVKGNVRVISNRANTLKRDATPEEIVAIAMDIVMIEQESSKHQLPA
jgi:hypothetical protein